MPAVAGIRSEMAKTERKRFVPWGCFGGFDVMRAVYLWGEEEAGTIVGQEEAKEEWEDNEGLEVGIEENSRSRWPRDLRRRSAATRLRCSRVRIPLTACIFV